MNSKRPPININVRSFVDSVNSSTSSKQQPGEIHNILVEDIICPQVQPRRYFEHDSIGSLAESILQHGILQPLIVRPFGEDKYELVAGERRLRAAQMINLSAVPVILKELSDREAKILTLTENLQREDLNPIEETEGILSLLSVSLEIEEEEIAGFLHRLSRQLQGKNKSANNVVSTEQISLIDDIFRTLGKFTFQSFAQHRLPLLNLPSEVLEVLRKGQIAYTKAREIAKIQDKEERNLILSQCISQNWSLSQIKDYIKSLKTETVEKSQMTSPVHRVKNITKKLNQLKIWQKDQKAWQKIERNLSNIERLMSEFEPECDN